MDQLPFVKNVPHDGRAVFLSAYHDTDKHEWFLYAEVEKGKFGRLAGGSCYRGIYLSTAPEDPERDIEYLLGTFVTQHFSFPGILDAFFRITSDYHNLACVLEKFHLISRRPDQQRSASGFLIESEVEYLMLLIRSLYDLIQRFAKNAGTLVRSPEERSKRMFSNLPNGFADACLHSNQPISASEMQRRWGLFPPIATFYEEEVKHFLKIRAVRDQIAHHGKDIPIIFDLDEGMAVDTTVQPWSLFDVWQNQPLTSNALGPLRALLASLILNAVGLPARFETAYRSCVATPPAIAPGLRCFLRDPFGHHLVSLHAYLSKPWERSNKGNA